MKKYLLVISLLFCGSANAQIVDIHALINTVSNPVSIFLQAGAYDITVVGIAGGGLYDAWHPWGSTVGCDASGTNCAQGWSNSYHVESTEFAPFQPTGVNGHWETPAIALAHAVDSSFVLLNDVFVEFSISDSFYSDNLGGMSLSVTGVPLPAGFGLLLLGIVGLFRFRKNP